MKLVQLFRIVGLALVLTLAVGACGGGGSSGENLDDFLPSGPGGATAPPINPPGSTPPPPSDDTPVPLAFRILDMGTGSLLTTPQNRIAGDQVAWGSLWVAHKGVMPPGIGAPDPAPPILDFTTEIVVGVFLGTRPTGGYMAGVLSVTTDGAAGATVSFEERQPGSNCITTQALTQPFIIIAIPRVSGAIGFSGTVRVVNCP